MVWAMSNQDPDERYPIEFRLTQLEAVARNLKLNFLTKILREVTNLSEGTEIPLERQRSEPVFANSQNLGLCQTNYP